MNSLVKREPLNNNGNVPVDDDTDSKTTTVNGKGLWRSWKRNFKSKFLALLDLIDNSLDATIQENMQNTPFKGKLHVYADEHSHKTTGLCIVNNSIKKIKPLERVLEAYNSLKTGADTVGENGVGLKQGCATLSDRSFVLVKDSLEGTIQLGVVAQSLQREEGPYLPSFTFSSSSSLKDQMVKKFSKNKHSDVKRCIEQYGAASHSSDPDFLIGIERLCRHANSICSNTFAENPYVFLLVLDKVHHHQTNEYVQDQWDAQQKKTVKDLLKELEVGLPKTYLHIPNNFDFTIGGKSVDFAKYWTARLVELSSFTVNINKRIPFQQNFEHQDTYQLRIFVGFDTMRVTEPSAGKEASLYVYSRQSGRLITQYDDARTLLKLSAGGTMFCQGLTIIIDDVGGHLPLNPTKEQIAFGEEDRGEIHKDNLFAWIGCMVHFYYNHQLDKFGKKKTALTKKVAELSDNLQTSGLKSLDSSSFTTYQLTSKPIGQNIRVDKSSVKEKPGKDTLYRLKTSKSSGTKSSKVASATSVSTTKPGRKRKATNIELQQLSDDIPRRKKPVSYRETETDEEEEDGEVGGSDDDRKQPARRATQNGRGNANDSTDQSMSENTKTTEEQAARDNIRKPITWTFVGI